MTTVLEKCGVTEEIIKFLKRKGLIVPEKIESVENPLRSPSEDWFFSIADRFTPPLSKAENEVFKKVPYLLSLQILKSIDLEIDVSAVLYDALERVKTEIEKAEEKVAAILAILRIFHGCLDYNVLKYDRHLEYHEYEESPVGHIFKRLKEILSKATKDVHDKEDWVNQKLLEILAGTRRILLVNEYSISCKEVYKILKKEIPNIDSLSPNEVVEKIKKDYPDIFEIVKEFSEGFYKFPEEFITDSLISKDVNPLEKIIENKRRAKETLNEICSKLNIDEANELERIVEIIDEFSAIQEIEGAAAAGVHPRMKNRIFDVLIEGYDQLKTILKSNINLIKSEFREKVSFLLEGEDIPSKFIADREFVTEGEKLFDGKVRELYFEEIERWKKL
ncbi:MAG: hypothetical protein ACE5KE_04060 [Methanosarcinales archaeon]